jgi:beta-ureidopropionase / N-carbamoyl-L-amino-acid hydrolase
VGGVRVNGPRLLERIEQFAQIGRTNVSGVDRQALSVRDREARRLLAEIGLSRGFQISQDSMANLFLRREGSNRHAPPLLIGSHLDTQPNGGKFDGALGTLAALEVIETLEDKRIDTDLPIEVVAWTNEEGSRFSPGSMGSAAFSSRSMPENLGRPAVGDAGILESEIAATIAALPQAKSRPLGFDIHGYIELHIEQGRSLELGEIPVGIVSGIQATRWLEIHVSGEAGHAGTTEYEERKDALVATVAALDELFGTVMPQDPDSRLTVGRLTVAPGSTNVIPEKVTCSLDLRHPHLDRLDEIDRTVRRIFMAAAARYRCKLDVTQLLDMPPVQFSEAVLRHLDAAALKSNLRARRLISRAFHDALFISRVAPTGMIFVPCRGGVSHNEKEYVEPEHSVSGAQMLLASVLEMVDARQKQPEEILP